MAAFGLEVQGTGPGLVERRPVQARRRESQHGGEVETPCVDPVAGLRGSAQGVARVVGSGGPEDRSEVEGPARVVGLVAVNRDAGPVPGPVHKGRIQGTGDGVHVAAFGKILQRVF